MHGHGCPYVQTGISKSTNAGVHQFCAIDCVRVSSGTDSRQNALSKLLGGYVMLQFCWLVWIAQCMCFFVMYAVVDAELFGVVFSLKAQNRLRDAKIACLLAYCT